MPRYVQPSTPVPHEVAAVISLLGINPLRIEILRYLAQHPEGGTSGAIGKEVGAGYKTVLWHLKQLEEQEFVLSDGAEKERGQRVLYQLNLGSFEAGLKSLEAYVKGS